MRLVTLVPFHQEPEAYSHVADPHSHFHALYLYKTLSFLCVHNNSQFAITRTISGLQYLTYHISDVFA